MCQLFVPIHVEALVVGKNGKEVKDMCPSFAGLNKRPIGSVAAVEPMRTAQLVQGIHLHWTMPDSLLHGTKKEGVEFPVLPNRWIIQRFQKKEKLIERKVWRIASDAVYAYNPFEPPDTYGNDSITIPMYEYRDDMWIPCGPTIKKELLPNAHGYLGYCTPMTDDIPFSEPSCTVPLTAVGWGDPEFAAVYQKCASCFGFCDKTLEEEAAEYTYLVCGYYTNREDDPLSNIKETIEELTWTIIDSDDDKVPSRTICHGTVCHVKWPGKNGIVEDRIPKGEVEIAVGNNSAEAMAALLQEKHPEEKGMERLLLYQQQDTWKKLLNAEGDDLIEIEQEAHRRQFSDVLSGYRYELEANDEKEKFDSLKISDYLQLEDLNTYQRELEELHKLQNIWAQRLYVFWCNYIFLYIDMYDNQRLRTKADETAFVFFVDEIKKSQRSCSDCKEKIKTVEERISAVKEQLKKRLQRTNLTLVKKEYGRGYEPNSPVVLVHGEGVNRSYRQGFQKNNDGFLPCRLYTITQVTLKKEDEKNVSDEDVKRYLTQKPRQMPDFCEALAVETILLDESFFAILLEAHREEGLKTETEKNGAEPFSISFCEWVQPWNPIELIWKVELFPIIQEFQSEDILQNFSLAEMDLEWEERRETSCKESFIVSGSTLLTPHASYTMSERLREISDNNLGLIRAVEQQNTLSQQLEGFTQDCLGMKDTLQIPMYWRFWDEKATGLSLKELQKSVGNQVLEPAGTQYEYLPIRSGVGSIKELWIVDSFGQIKEVQTDKKQAKIHIAESLRMEEQKKFFLPPRFLEACTVSVQWLSSKTGLRDAVSPETTPVCGFVRPDLVNKSITLYDNRGQVLASLETAKDICHFTPYQKDVLRPEDIPDKVLREFAITLKEEKDALKELLDYFNIFFDNQVYQKESSDFYQCCFGKILALARISIGVNSLTGYVRRLRTDSGGKTFFYDTNGYENCKFRIRIGDMRKDRDGLFGFFLSEQDSELPNMSKMCAVNLAAARYGKNFIQPENEWTHTLESPQKVLTLLFEPFSQISIRTGLLPEYTLKLEEYFFRDAVSKMQTVFPAWPLIHPEDAFHIPIPECEKDRWIWLNPVSRTEFIPDSIGAADTSLYSGRKKISEGYIKLKKEGERE